MRSPEVAGPDVEFPGRSLAAMTVHDALRSLSVEHRQAIIAAHFHDESLADIARREHSSEAAAKAHLHEALHALRLAVEQRGVQR